MRNANLPEAEKTAIRRAIEAQLRPEMPGLEITSEAQLSEKALDTRIKLVDLNRGGTPEVIAQSMVGCGATGNCSFWIFRKTGRDYKLILDGYGQTFTVQKESSNGFRDIVVASHASATDSGLTLFRYEGGQYREAGCYEANWAPIVNGVRRELKDPLITPSSCGD